MVNYLQNSSSWSCGAPGVNGEHSAAGQFMGYIMEGHTKLSGVGGVQGKFPAAPVC